MRTIVALLAVVAALCTATPAAASAAATRSCPQSEPDNGIRDLRAARLSCARAFAVARRTNAVKCFLNGSRCIHRFRGRAWTCTLDERSMRVRCRSGRRVARYRLG